MPLNFSIDNYKIIRLCESVKANRNKGKNSHCKTLFIKKKVKEIIYKFATIAGNFHIPLSQTDRTTRTTTTKKKLARNRRLEHYQPP